jgi:ribosome production factor 1
VDEFCSIFPNAQFVKRGSQFEVKRIVELAVKREYTDVIVINEDKKQPSTFNRCYICIHEFSLTITGTDAITFIHLPYGPTAHFKLTSVKLNKDIRVMTSPFIF